MYCVGSGDRMARAISIQHAKVCHGSSDLAHHCRPWSTNEDKLISK